MFLDISNKIIDNVKMIIILFFAKFELIDSSKHFRYLKKYPNIYVYIFRCILHTGDMYKLRLLLKYVFKSFLKMQGFQDLMHDF